MGSSHPDTRNERTWYKLCDNDSHIRVILVEAPLTFGHSQLIITTRKNIKEDIKFEMASFAIGRCLPIIKKCIPAAVKDDTWKELREYTATKGRYIKTLILRASADENEDQYKVHLAPYFNSNLKSTKILFQEGRNLENDPKGGLLRWLGEREKYLDDNIETLRNTDRFPTALIESFELIKLARFLRETVETYVR